MVRGRRARVKDRRHTNHHQLEQERTTREVVEAWAPIRRGRMGTMGMAEEVGDRLLRDGDLASPVVQGDIDEKAERHSELVFCSGAWRYTGSNLRFKIWYIGN